MPRRLRRMTRLASRGAHRRSPGPATSPALDASVYRQVRLALNDLALEGRNTLARNDLDDTAQFPNAVSQPGEILGADMVALRVARLHIGVLQKVEASAIRLGVVRPDMEEPPIKLARQSAQMLKIMAVGGLCRASDYAA